MSEPAASARESRPDVHMRWASALSQAPRLAQAVDEVSASVRATLDGRAPDLLLAFVSPHFRGRYEELPHLLQASLAPRVLLGCSAVGVIGGGREVEDEPGLSVVAASLPGVTLHPFHVESGELPTPDEGPGAWERVLGAPREDGPTHFVLLSDPSSCDASRLTAGLDFAYPGAVTLGGLASDSAGNALFLESALLSSGAVGVALQGNLVVEPIVAQGARPLGEPLVVTRCQQNLLLEVQGRRPTEVLADIYEALPEEQRGLLQGALLLGIASTGLRDPGQPQDYLMRNVLGVDPKRGILAVGALLRPGQTVQFHVRDAAAATEDLDRMLERFQAASRPTPPAGALVFTCAGRGAHLFGEPDHDSRAFTGCVGEVPLGGFFCAGELGPVGPDTCLLGYTSAFAVFRPAEAPA